MIIQGLLNVLYTLLDALMLFEIPSLPEQATEYMTTAFDYMASASGLLANYVPLAYLLALFGVIIGVDMALVVWEFAIWVYRKIPGGQS